VQRGDLDEPMERVIMALLDTQLAGYCRQVNDFPIGQDAPVMAQETD